VSLENAARLMRANGLNTRGRRSFIVTADSRHGPAVGDHIPNREFHAEQAGTKWVSSYQRYAITRLRSGGDWVFLTAAFDLYDRNVIGRAFSADMETVYTAIPAMEMACANRKARKGNCRNNACTGTFFKTLKREPETLDGSHSVLDYVAPMGLTQGKSFNGVYLMG
jgi:transposase InsO family protein